MIAFGGLADQQVLSPLLNYLVSFDSRLNFTQRNLDLVFDAVWSDPSDPGKTYLNAAQALLTELRKRAGINMLMTTHQPYKH